MRVPMTDDKSTDDKIRRLFAKWIVPINPTQDETKSKMLDSPEMESRYAVDHLTKKQDGTTVVRYYFSSATTEIRGLCTSEALLHSECMPLSDNVRRMARETMKAIAAESGAKIEFDEVFSLDEADVALVKPAGALNVSGEHVDGCSGKRQR
jgi:hypothetical protein